MRSTPYHHYALYEADAAPDLTATGEYNSAIMGIDADLHAEETERKAADTALGSRIDNAETEISANSADLTGIKGLTYGKHHINFLESHNGEYTSPSTATWRTLRSCAWATVNCARSSTSMPSRSCPCHMRRSEAMEGA